MIYILPVVFLISLMSLYSLYHLAHIWKLVDKPNSRKLHDGCIPLIGGLAVYISMLFMSVCNFANYEFEESYILFSSCLVLLGAADDRYDICPKIRLFLLFLISTTLVVLYEYNIYYFGDLNDFGGVYIYKPYADVFSVLAIVFCIICFNMIDGLDGLLGSITIITLFWLSLFFLEGGKTYYFWFCMLFITALVPSLLCNLGFWFFKKYKIFMGDNGSFLIGFTIIWLIISTQPEKVSYNIDSEDLVIRPVTVLWLIAIPLMDMLTVIFKRLIKGNSPLKADRTHLHHLFLSIGLSEKKTLMMIVFMSALFASVGSLGEIFLIQESTMFYAFLYSFIIFFVFNVIIDDAVGNKFSINKII